MERAQPAPELIANRTRYCRQRRKLDEALVEEVGNFDRELLQERIAIETRRVRGDVTVMAGDGYAG